MSLHKIKFHQDDVQEGRVFEVQVKVGDHVNAGQNLISVETDKLTVDITSDVSGKVAKVLVHPGDVIKQGQEIIEIEKH